MNNIEARQKSIEAVPAVSFKARPMRQAIHRVGNAVRGGIEGAIYIGAFMVFVKGIVNNPPRFPIPFGP